MEKITKANYKAPLYPIGDRFTMTPARVGHLNQVVDGINEVTSGLDEIITTASVTQGSSSLNNTGVTINSRAGVITMQGPLSPGAAATYTIPVTNSFVSATSVILLTIDYSGSGDAATNLLYGVDSVTSGSFNIIIRSASQTGTPIKINFLVIG